MKTITMDWEIYQNELKHAREFGFEQRKNILDKIEKAIKAMNGYSQNDVWIAKQELHEAFNLVKDGVE